MIYYKSSGRLMMDIPIETLRRLIQSLSGFLHIRKVLDKRILKFVVQNGKSPKIVLRSLMVMVMATTGANLRRILLQTDKVDVERLKVHDYTFIEYHELPEREAWKVGLVKELTDVKFGRVSIKNVNSEDVYNTLDYICTYWIFSLLPSSLFLRFPRGSPVPQYKYGATI